MGVAASGEAPGSDEGQALRRRKSSRSSKMNADAVKEALVAEFQNSNMDAAVIEAVVDSNQGDYVKSHDTITSYLRMERDRHRAATGRERPTRAMSGKERRKARSKAEVKKYKKLKKKRLEEGKTGDDIAKEIGADMRSKLEAVGHAREVKVMNKPRDGKHLLVLDMDYTMFDHQSEGTAKENRRPYLHYMLKRVYPYYDLVVWSQTHPARLKSILEQLGVYNNKAFPLVFVLDNSCMYHVTHEGEDGKLRSHEVKDLHYVWGKWPEHYNPCNTLHVDDYDANFAMNPDNGLLIEPFDAVRRTMGRDKTLKLLTKYLVSIKDDDDFSLLDLKRWRDQVSSGSSSEEYTKSTRKSSSSSSKSKSKSSGSKKSRSDSS